MSNPQVKQERSKAKDRRQQLAEEGIVSRKKKNKKSKPFSLYYRYNGPSDFRKIIWGCTWMRYGRYVSIETAERVMSDHKRKYDIFEYKIEED